MRTIRKVEIQHTGLRVLNELGGLSQGAFMRDQERMQRLVAESPLPRLERYIHANNLPSTVEKIADWLEATGGLWMDGY